MIEQAGKPSTDQHKLVVFTLLVIIGFVFTYGAKDCVDMLTDIQKTEIALEWMDDEATREERRE